MKKPNFFSGLIGFVVLLAFMISFAPRGSDAHPRKSSPELMPCTAYLKIDLQKIDQAILAEMRIDLYQSRPGFPVAIGKPCKGFAKSFIYFPKLC